MVAALRLVDGWVVIIDVTERSIKYAELNGILITLVINKIDCLML